MKVAASGPVVDVSIVVDVANDEATPVVVKVVEPVVEV